MSRLTRLLTAGLASTAARWPAIQQAYAWVHQAAQVLADPMGDDLLEVRRAYRTLLAEMRGGQDELGEVAPAVDHFLKVTKSYWPGLFPCYLHPALPRTNNDLEHCFGSVRYHERRATGRKGASPTLVVRGQVRLVAAVATRAEPELSEHLRPHDLAAWRTLRHDLAARQDTRRAQCRFRRDPDAYLRQLEDRLLKLSLPS